MQPCQKYARVEWERRFLLDHFPTDVKVTRVRRIVDRYLDGTTLRLRQQADAEGDSVFKLTQKLATKTTGAQQGLITTMYLTKDEVSIFAKLPAKTLKKTRYSVPPFGIDVFEDTLAGLVLAEAEFSSDSEASSLTLPPFIMHEVSHDDEFTGGYLAGISRHELEDLLAKYGIMLSTNP